MIMHSKIWVTLAIALFAMTIDGNAQENQQAPLCEERVRVLSPVNARLTFSKDIAAFEMTTDCIEGDDKRSIIGRGMVIASALASEGISRTFFSVTLIRSLGASRPELFATGDIVSVPALSRW